MLVLFETAAGFALFKLLDDGKLTNPEQLWRDFETPEAANQAFQKFENMNDAVSSVTAILEGKLSKDLRKFLKDSIDDASIQSEQLAVADQKLGTAINKKIGIKVVSDSTILDLYRGIRQQLDALISDVNSNDISSMALGLSHSLSRYKLKFSPDKVDTMIIQAIGLLDDLDKELNTYSMRVKEWYGWHFPEMSRIVVDNLAYAKVVQKMGFRSNAQKTDFSDILPEDIEKDLKEAAEISMGTEIAEDDILNIRFACDQVVSLSEYRAELFQYLQNRMSAIAPNLTTLVGDLVGARLIAHAGSLMSLAKAPASTVQILGAEKALFRALKTKHDTPKYGLIYHASLVGQAAQKNKGKVARVLATKTSLAARIDALGEEKDTAAEAGRNYRTLVETRLRYLEGRNLSVGSTSHQKMRKFDSKGKSTATYNTSADVSVSMDAEQS
ncbi:3930_t:CDS:2 [Ambispora gerdemannii]|uniref:Nucleolar protein 58 n=1 Tax=Ambispora gerdemannii TaxID=144530 RepID=A0A9N9CAB8_9GLOM|nr:3930_t:CDS:2 [Ambispora gerdemannii]